MVTSTTQCLIADCPVLTLDAAEFLKDLATGGKYYALAPNGETIEVPAVKTIFDFCIRSQLTPSDKAQEMVTSLVGQDSFQVVPKKMFDKALDCFDRAYTFVSERASSFEMQAFHLKKEVTELSKASFKIKDVCKRLEKFAKNNILMNLGGFALFSAGIVGYSYTPKENKKTRWSYAALSVVGASLILFSNLKAYTDPKALIASLTR